MTKEKRLLRWDNDETRRRLRTFEKGERALIKAIFDKDRKNHK